MVAGRSGWRGRTWSTVHTYRTHPGRAGSVCWGGFAEFCWSGWGSGRARIRKWPSWAGEAFAGPPGAGCVCAQVRGTRGRVVGEGSHRGRVGYPLLEPGVTPPVPGEPAGTGVTPPVLGEVAGLGVRGWFGEVLGAVWGVILPRSGRGRGSGPGVRVPLTGCGPATGVVTPRSGRQPPIGRGSRRATDPKPPRFRQLLCGQTSERLRDSCVLPGRGGVGQESELVPIPKGRRRRS